MKIKILLLGLCLTVNGAATVDSVSAKPAVSANSADAKPANTKPSNKGSADGPKAEKEYCDKVISQLYYAQDDYCEFCVYWAKVEEKAQTRWDEQCGGREEGLEKAIYRNCTEGRPTNDNIAAQCKTETKPDSKPDSKPANSTTKPGTKPNDKPAGAKPNAKPNKPPKRKHDKWEEPASCEGIRRDLTFRQYDYCIFCEFWEANKQRAKATWDRNCTGSGEIASVVYRNCLNGLPEDYTVTCEKYTPAAMEAAEEEECEGGLSGLFGRSAQDMAEAGGDLLSDLFGDLDFDLFGCGALSFTSNLFLLLLGLFPLFFQN